LLDSGLGLKEATVPGRGEYKSRADKTFADGDQLFDSYSDPPGAGRARLHPALVKADLAAGKGTETLPNRDELNKAKANVYATGLRQEK